MTPHDALAEGRLADAIATQEAAVCAAPTDLAARRFLIDLFAFAGRLDDAPQHLAEIKAQTPAWQEIESTLTNLFRAEKLRSFELLKPHFHPQPPPKHASRRWLAMKMLQRNRPDQAIRCIDAAEAVTPEVWGFIDGQEFEGLRDADDCFASVLEAFQDGEYHWFAWEAVRKVKLEPAEVLLDQLYRPATITMKDNSVFDVHLPLVYTGSHGVDECFALGTLTDHICPDQGPTRCVGGKLLLIGDDAEVPLRECRMIEIR
jgi:type VI secretion system protein ImpE